MLDTNIYANFRSGAYQELIKAPSDYLSSYYLLQFSCASN